MGSEVLKLFLSLPPRARSWELTPPAGCDFFPDGVQEDTYVVSNSAPDSCTRDAVPKFHVILGNQQAAGVITKSRDLAGRQAGLE